MFLSLRFIFLFSEILLACSVIDALRLGSSLDASSVDPPLPSPITTQAGLRMSWAVIRPAVQRHTNVDYTPQRVMLSGQHPALHDHPSSERKGSTDLGGVRTPSFGERAFGVTSWSSPAALATGSLPSHTLTFKPSDEPLLPKHEPHEHICKRTHAHTHNDTHTHTHVHTETHTHRVTHVHTETHTHRE